MMAASSPPPPHPPRAEPDAPSAYQRAVLEYVEKERGHAVVMATAGSGKTTTLVAVAGALPPGSRACFLAFNRSAAAELRLRLPPTVDATTIHALGRAALVRSHPAVAAKPPDASKYRHLAGQLVRGSALERSGAAVANYLAALADFARLDLADPSDEEAVASLLPRYGLEAPVSASKVPELHELLGPLLSRGSHAAAAGSVDFTDMVYLTATEAHPLERYDFVCVDEAQDLSRMSLALVMRLVKEGARALFVGDPRQAIYAFAGADRRSLERIREHTGATALPLSVSYRCPTRHVTLARRFAPEMEPGPRAVRGRVGFLPEAALAKVARPGDLVLSRVNAPLVGAALSLASAGVSARVLGEEIATEALDLARRVFGGGAELPSGAAAAVELHEREEALRLEQELIASPRLPWHLARSSDSHRALALLLRAAEEHRARGAQALAALLRPPRVTFADLEESAIRLLAQADVAAGVLLSTIHKAKGREAERVFLLRPEELGVAGHDQDDEVAEANVLFVALTRAKREYVFLERSSGAVAERLRGRSRRPPAPGLERSWDEVLSLALVMARADATPRWPWRRAP